MRILSILSCICTVVVYATPATAQDLTAARFRRMSDAAGARGLAEPYKEISSTSTFGKGLGSKT